MSRKLEDKLQTVEKILARHTSVKGLLSKTQYKELLNSTITNTDFPGGAVVKNPPANAGDTGSSPGLGRTHMP